ncbi:hypothetical protein [Microbacterium sp. JZ31]|uniref:hypothetical protein n=1 Tax=Microbacterium sp. JZ31 TaxID=1906274 RepID=UPI0019334B25|nr:hypothetical protein [Microbacterium sp. JZ31]
MPMRTVTSILVLVAALSLAACAPARSEAEQTYRDWMRAVDDFRRQTPTEDTVPTIRRLSSADMMHALQWNLSGYVGTGHRQTGYRHVVVFRFVDPPPTPGTARSGARITADVCVDASLTGEVDAEGEPVALTRPPRHERLVTFTTDADGRPRVHEDVESQSDVCG